MGFGNSVTFCAFLLCFDAARSGTGDRPVVAVSQGKLEGIQQTSRNGKLFNAFLGIPFGKAERFQYSVEAENWNGTLDASKFGSDCIQFDVFNQLSIRGAEECLFLNVYSPQVTNDTQPLPTLVYIHGGGFSSGSGNDYGPKYFMDSSCILVTINYRLGLFGATNTGFGSNFGLKDQVLALKWIKNNIAAFSGNPNAITIFGESAGGISVNLHLLSPMSKGLFSKGISQSGTIHNTLIPISGNTDDFQKLGRLMGCPNKASSQEILDCLKRIDATAIVTKIRDALITPDFRFEDIPAISIAVEKGTPEAFLPEHPLDILSKGDYASIPWMNGVVTWEGFVAIGLHPGIKALYKNGTDGPGWNAIAPRAFGFQDGDDQKSESIKEFYFENKTDTSSVAVKFANLLSDYTFLQPAKASAVLYAKKAPVYLYYFSLKGTHSYFSDLTPLDENGFREPAHGDELQYQFNYHTKVPYFPEIEANSTFHDASNRMVNLWVAFASNAQLISPEKSGESKEWKALDNSNGDTQWFNLDKEYNMVSESEIFGQRLKFWDNLGKKN